MSKERQLRKQDEIKNIILEAARQIIAQEGFEGLSIRKITKAIDYSPAIIYHYFKDKNEIVESLVGQGFQRILATVRNVKKNEEEPEEEIKEVFTNYIKASLAYPEEYKAFMLNGDPTVLVKTGLLEQGISRKSPTMKTLTETLQRGIQQGRFLPHDPELTAQILWTAAFGLIIKLIVEKNIPPEQVDRLIEQHFMLLFGGIMARKEAK